MNTKALTHTLTRTIELGIVLSVSTLVPFLAHAAHIQGDVWLPIFTTVIIASYFLNPISAVLLAGLTPMANHLVTGMPMTAPMPMMQMLTLELLVLAVSIQYLKQSKIGVSRQLVIALFLSQMSAFMFLPNLPVLAAHILRSGPGLVFNGLAAFLAVRYFASPGPASQ